MKKLLKRNECNSDMEYYEMIVESVINGQREQVREQFNAMPKENKKAFVKAIYTNWGSGLEAKDKGMFFDLL